MAEKRIVDWLAKQVRDIWRRLEELEADATAPQKVDRSEKRKLVLAALLPRAEDKLDSVALGVSSPEPRSSSTSKPLRPPVAPFVPLRYQTEPSFWQETRDFVEDGDQALAPGQAEDNGGFGGKFTRAAHSQGFSSRSPWIHLPSVGTWVIFPHRKEPMMKQTTQHDEADENLELDEAVEAAEQRAHALPKVLEAARDHDFHRLSCLAAAFPAIYRDAEAAMGAVCKMNEQRIKDVIQRRRGTQAELAELEAQYEALRSELSAAGVVKCSKANAEALRRTEHNGVKLLELRRDHQTLKEELAKDLRQQQVFGEMTANFHLPNTMDALQQRWASLQKGYTEQAD